MDFATALAQAGGTRVRDAVKSSDRFAFKGGLDVMDPPMSVSAGQLLGCLNYEPGVRGGYRRFDGCERYDGHTSPSNGNYVALNTNAGYTPSVGSTVTESGSGATGVVAYIDLTNNYVVLVNTTGTFVGNGSSLTGGGLTIGNPYVNGAPTNALADSYYYQKFLYLQALIGAVGGAACSGAVLGAIPYLNHVYAFRNNAAGSAATMWKSTSSGWTQVAFGSKVYFNAGVYANAMAPPAEGTVVTGTTSGATFTIQRIIAKTGTWGTDAAGYLITSAITGTPVANETFKVGATVYFTYLSQAAQTLPPGGNYHFRLHNFNVAQNPTTGYRLYGVNGVGYGFEYDAIGNVMVLIETGMNPDTPDHLEIHADYLFYSFGGSLQNSGYQLPLSWNAVFGADSRSVGEPVMFLREDVSQTLVIGTRRRIWTLTGISVELFQIQVYAANTGAIDYTDESPGQMVFMEDRGITSLAAASQYGNFEAGALSDKILKILTTLNANDTVAGAIVTRKKNLYRLFFASGTVLCLAINAQGQFTGWTQGIYPFTVLRAYCGFSQAVTNGPQIERAFLCCSDGYVRELDQGRSFDGQVMNHFLRLSYYDSRSPDLYKRYRKLTLDVQPEGDCTIQISVDYDYGNRLGAANPPLSFSGNGGFWDVSTWDQFEWSQAIYTQAIMKVDGEGYNIGLFIAGSAINDMPLTAHSASLQWSPRILNRNTKDG